MIEEKEKIVEKKRAISLLLASNPVVLYDGDCGFCNRSVQFVLKNERGSSLHFVPIQSPEVSTYFEERNWTPPDLSTMFFVYGDTKWEKSTAGLKIASFLKFPASLLRIGWICPKFIRDVIYNSIAKRRKRIYKGFCALPDAETLKRFHR